MTIQGILQDLKSQRNRLTAAIDALEGATLNNRRGRHKRRKMSAAARAKIAAAQRARWAKQRRVES